MRSNIHPSAGEPISGGFDAPFQFTHDLADHPLLTRQSLADLAERLPAGQVEVSKIDAPVVAGRDYAGEQLTSGTASALLDTSTPRSVYLYNVEVDPEFAMIVDEVLDEAMTLLDVDPVDVVSREGYVFVAGDRALTSAHVDHECNFLFVISGSKRVWLAPVGDVAGEEALEALHSGRYGTCEARPTSMVPHDLGPGEGVFIPPRAAHYVENGPLGCVALSTVFLHRTTSDEVGVYAWNARLRRLGLRPTPPGESMWRDAVKRWSHRLIRSVISVGRTVRPVGAGGKPSR